MAALKVRIKSRSRMRQMTKSIIISCHPAARSTARDGQPPAAPPNTCAAP
ncbi:hypothetical protein LSH36_173g02048 [Paralvinella palmiformis]|uniref:Uncharacterized protein n=1 Tax=Paralvinella palmiformis TaxID=53620 RepID=A0AAD9JSB3_9ANNE|nr:hypothetical protein LSH36_173g02048 [Paralvinella palmiformis]